MEGTQLAPPPEVAKAPMPVMDVVAPPPTPPSASPSPSAQPLNKAALPSMSKAKKAKDSGVGGAIFTAVVIVLGLAALAVYAYLKQPR